MRRYCRNTRYIEVGRHNSIGYFVSTHHTFTWRMKNMFGGRKTVVAKWLRNASKACDCRIFVPSVNVSSPAASCGKAVGMPATTIHFVRHGKVENPGHLLYERLPGFHLSEVGVRMAQATAHYIAVNPRLNTVSAIYSSPLERTRETAGEILTALNEVRETRGEETLNSPPTSASSKRATNSAARASATAKARSGKTATGSWYATCGSQAGVKATSRSRIVCKRSPSKKWGASGRANHCSQPRIAHLELQAHAGNRAPGT